MSQFFEQNLAVETALEGCPDPTAGRAVIVAASSDSIEVCHYMRDKYGNPLNNVDSIALPTTTTVPPTTTAEPTTTTAPGSTTTDEPTTTAAPTTTTTPEPTTTTSTTTTSTTSPPATTTPEPTTTTPAPTTTTTIEDLLYGTTTLCPPTTTGEPVSTTQGPTTTPYPNVAPAAVGSYAYVVDAMCDSGTPVQVPIELTDVRAGLVCFNLPTSISTKPGIYAVQVKLNKAGGIPYMSDTFLLSVEESLENRFFSSTTRGPGPLTLAQVRMRLRDFAGENVALLDTVEFKDAEILEALLAPIRIYNETPPFTHRVSAATFAAKELWLDGATATLMKMAAMYYLRNGQRLKYGDGATEDESQKYMQYMQLADQQLSVFKSEIRRLKILGNWSTGASSFGGTGITRW